MKLANRSRQQGTAIVEFALVAPLLVLMFLGTVGVGISLGRSIHTVQFCRDMAHMYADGVDFSVTANKDMAVRLSQRTDMTATGGNGVVIFSKIMTVYQADCTAATVSPCTNLGLAVITQRVVVGNAALRTSDFGTPAPAILDAQGNISPNVYLSNSSNVRAPNFTPLLTAAGTTQQQSDSAWVTETYFTYPTLNFFFSSAPGVYTRFIY
jgi:Flp pilus assembly protein TadG